MRLRFILFFISAFIGTTMNAGTNTSTPSASDPAAYAAEANARIKAQATRAGIHSLTQDVPDDIYALAQSLYPRAIWQEPNPDDQITPVKILKSVPPKYPYAYRLNGYEAKIWVAFVVDSKGKVTDVKSLTESRPYKEKFITAALAAVQKWTFEPAIKNGQQVATLAMVQFEFQLKNR